ncbi:putative pyrroline-5-carboxylate reductase [Gregarina niphandrodes]|uniref:Pyrroline-5-carboxylate reductase n=1 Tax=Gregarina niphandrodes TaxID=110365 RepID=A0A023B564_GRENI|nr:putative pyrroline-5-carboxylate reductase [Gregarina niphandrodes]EZG58485.1 putative pyrroline-5-carboxylate reductase [Gregarina niphandrodes]|eukprot:XP_011130958.1 putative pyrroline-5-carboxylate reductase [Gregarina niphandrodes]
MDTAFEEVLNDRTLCYIDNIIIIATDRPFEEVLQRVEKMQKVSVRIRHSELDEVVCDHGVGNEQVVVQIDSPCCYFFFLNPMLIVDLRSVCSQKTPQRVQENEEYVLVRVDDELPVDDFITLSEKHKDRVLVAYTVREVDCSQSEGFSGRPGDSGSGDWLVDAVAILNAVPNTIEVILREQDEVGKDQSPDVFYLANSMQIEAWVRMVLVYIPKAVAAGVEAMADQAPVSLDSQTQRELAVQCMMGSALMAQKARDTHFGQLKDNVTTPGGITIRGLKVMRANGMQGAVMQP